MSSVRYLAKRVERRMRRILARGEAIRRERLALMTRRPVESVATVSADPVADHSEYVAKVHGRCDMDGILKRTRANRRNYLLLHSGKAKSRRSVASRGMSHRQAIAAYDRLRASGLLPAPRSLPKAKPIPDVTLPAWCEGLKEDELGLAWLASVEFSSADSLRWIARARSVARDERTGRYGGDDARTTTIVRDGSTAYVAADGATVKDWLARDRDTTDDHSVALERIAILRRELGGKLADCLAAGMSQAEAASVCCESLRTVERRLQVVRRLVASIS